MAAFNDQHFMTDKSLIKDIVKLANLNSNDVVLEVGSGTGLLTRELTKKAKRVIAIEKDSKLAGSLNFQNLDVINADALKISFPEFTSCVSNIPYSISKKLVLKLMLSDFRCMVLTVQKEFAEKLLAKTGSDNYTALSVFSQLRADMSLERKVPRTSFQPQPRVDSVVVKFIPKQRLTAEFYNFLNKLFQQKNKKLRNVLPKEKHDKAPRELLEKKVRDITPTQFHPLFSVYSKN